MRVFYIDLREPSPVRVEVNPRFCSQTNFTFEYKGDYVTAKRDRIAYFTDEADMKYKELLYKEIRKIRRQLREAFDNGAFKHGERERLILIHDNMYSRYKELT